MMTYSYADYQTAAAAIDAKSAGFRPDIIMVLGSGLGYLGERIDSPVAIPYEEIPGFMSSTAPGHAGRLLLGVLQGRKVAVMQGRLHAYEGYSFEEICFPLRVLCLLGCAKLIITNASGGVNPQYRAGDIVLITDHIKLFPDSPLRGPNVGQFGPRFPDSTYLYTPSLQTLAESVAQQIGIPLQKGVYMYFPGPSYETPAEVRAARVLGADLVGMSTVPEVIAAGHAGMEVLGFSLVTNAAAGIQDKPLCEQEVLQAAQAAQEQFSTLVLQCLKRF